jgi:hypothetical protein
MTQINLHHLQNDQKILLPKITFHEIPFQERLGLKQNKLYTKTRESFVIQTKKTRKILSDSITWTLGH